MSGFDGIYRGSYFEGEPIGRTDVEGRVKKFKNKRTAGKDEVVGGYTIWPLKVV